MNWLAGKILAVSSRTGQGGRATFFGGSYYLPSVCTENSGEEFFAVYVSLPSAIADQRSTQKPIGTIGNSPAGYVYILPTDEPNGPVISAPKLIAQLKHLVSPGTK